MTMIDASARETSAHLLRAAVHQQGTGTATRILERLFTLAFSDLVYPQIWEDPAVDLAAMDLLPTSRIVTIASGGCNVLNYLTHQPERVYAVDLNAAHIALNELKFETIRRAPDHASMYRFLGAADHPANEMFYNKQIAPFLGAATRDYWDHASGITRTPRHRHFCKGFYRFGLLGRFIGMAHGVARMYGIDPRRMLSAATQSEQIERFETEIAPLFRRRFVRAVLGHRAALYGLGIPPAQYDALLGNEAHMADVVCARLRKLACDFPVSENYFAWQAFQRSYQAGGKGPLPPYLQAGSFDVLRETVDHASVELISMTSFLFRAADRSLDRYVLLDAQDWMDDAALNALWREMTRTARPGARVIFRTAGTETILPGRVADTTLSKWSYQAARSLELTALDRSAIYGGFHLYTLNDHQIS